MIIFFEGGRLGNQIFQYCGLKKISTSETIYIYGMKSLKKTFVGIKALKTNYFFDYLIRRIGQKRFLYLSKTLGIIGFIEERLENGEIKHIRYPGILKLIYFCDTVYFQSEKLINHSIASKLELAPSILSKAKKIIEGKPGDLSECYFIHIRRGDYATFPYPDASAMLPKEWYCKQMGLIKNYCPNPYFIIVTDDVIFAAQEFQNKPDVYISTESEAVDLGIMSLCKGGILSASSFSWWGAYLARKNNASGIFIAPKYWWGYPLKEWLPQNIETNWINYVDAP